MMLFSVTALVDFGAMAITLWLGLYLLGRSFPHPIAMRAVVMLLALSVFFFGAHFNLYHQVDGTAAWRAVMLVIGLGTWYSLICQFMSARNRARLRWLEVAIYALGAVTVVLLLGTRSAFIAEQGNQLYVAHMGVGLPYTVYGLFQITVSISLLGNLLTGDRVGLSSLGRYFLLASFFPILGVGYGIFSLISPTPMPRLFQDLLTFSGVFLVGAAVARHQAMVERRISLPDFPITGVSVLGLASVYAYLVWRFGLDPEVVAFVMILAIFTHSIYDFVREFLDRLRQKQDNTFRKKLYSLENEKPSGQSLQLRLKISLGLLLQTLKASGGFIARRQGDEFVVVCSRNSLPPESRLTAAVVLSDDITQPIGEIPEVSWLAPVFDNHSQIAVIGLGIPRTRMNYSGDDLDLLAEVADRLGTLVFLDELQQKHTEQAEQSAAGAQVDVAAFNASADDLVLSFASNPDAGFVKIVEDGLRHLGDYSLLGESALASQIAGRGESHVERGKILYQILLAALESLRPAGERPKEPLPRIWYNYAVIYDAYVEGVPNREIMARLYISEGTFNRTRRNALRSLARLLLEKWKQAA